MSDLNARRDRSSLVGMTADLAQRLHNMIEQEFDRLRRDGITEVDAPKMVLSAVDIVRTLCAGECKKANSDYEKETEPLTRDVAVTMLADAESAQRERKDDSKNLPTGRLTEEERSRRRKASLSLDDICVPPPAYGMNTPNSIRKGTKRR